VSRAALLLAAAGAGLGCAPAVRQTEHPALSERGFKLERVAVAPFRLSGSAAREAQSGASDPDAGALVAAKVAEALSQSGLSVVAPEDVARALDGAGGSESSAADVARVAADRFGSTAVLLGSVSRYRERKGEALGTTEPASVGFEVTLVRAPGGEKLWSGVFDETQHGLTDNVFNAGRYPGGGTRWLTAEEMARWGAGEIAKTVPRER
jgi:hypothetical protein